MQAFAELCEQISKTTKKTEKVSLVAAYFRAQAELSEATTAAIFLSGRAFPSYEQTVLNVGGALLSRALLEVAGVSEPQLWMAYRKHGDLGSAAFDVLELRKQRRAKAVTGASIPLTLAEVESAFKRIAGASGPQKKSAIVRELLNRASPLEAKYLIKIITGELRIGLRESLVEEAIAKAYDASYPEVRRANMLLGDISLALRMAAEERLAEAKMRLFHPIGVMLASPVDSAEEAVAYFTDAEVEDKYDGIRAQAHSDGSKAKIFSRTRDDITEAFPELEAALLRFDEELILDGEIVAWDVDEGRALPFSELQQRIGRKTVDIELLRAVPVAYIAFDVIFADSELVIDLPLTERKRILQEIFGRLGARGDGPPFLLREPANLVRKVRKARGEENRQQGQLFVAEQPARILPDAIEAGIPLPPVLTAPVWRASSANELARLFDEAQARGNEGLMIKELSSPYSPGRRGKTWLKLKRELATLDVIVTAVEYGHGKRAGVLSDYTFAVRDGEQLLNVGKAYSGLTDVEIAEMTQWFLAHTIEDHGHTLVVEPKIVIEVAFNNVMRSERHESGYALRFPRIVRIRDEHDKTVRDIDTVERVQEIFEKQKAFTTKDTEDTKESKIKNKS